MRFSVTSGTGTTEVVDHLESARSALDRALDLVSRKRKNVRVFDENGLFRSLRICADWQVGKHLTRGANRSASRRAAPTTPAPASATTPRAIRAIGPS